jgi:hypothetical protein
MVERLVAAGSDPRAATVDGYTPFDYAAALHKSKMMELLDRASKEP